jgi:sugar phosphate isomerase/epimerase
MFVACSTLCFSKEPLESALRHIAELEFDKIELAIIEGGNHLQPSEVAENPEQAIHRLRHGPSLTPSALSLDFGALDAVDPLFRKRFEAMCRMAKPLTVAVLTIAAAPLGTSFDDEVERLTALASHAMREGLVLAVETHSRTLTADPAVAIALCQAVPGLGLTLDPSHYIQGPHRGADFDAVYPYVQNVHLRDTGKGPDEFQVRIGQGEVEYGRIVSLLERHGYDRGLTVSIGDGVESDFDIEVEVRKLKLLLESLI